MKNIILLISLTMFFTSCIKVYECPDCPDLRSVDTVMIRDTITIRDTIILETFDVYDIDGNGYHVVEIGNQIWLKENLKTTRYNDGTPILHITDRVDWAYNDEGAYCYYNQNPDLGYGALYNKWAVYTGKLCPVGWHVPDDGEWKDLAMNYGGVVYAGGALKSKDYWLAPNEGATNESGFTALPGGGLFEQGGRWPFAGLGRYGNWWTSSIPTDRYNSSTTVQIGWGSAQMVMVASPFIDKHGLSVRCIKD